MKYKYIGVDPLTPAIGALISGVDISTEITREIVEEIESAFHNHLVLFFEDQKLTPSQLVDFAKRFGKIGYYPFVQGMEAQPEVVEVVKNEDEKINLKTELFSVDGSQRYFMDESDKKKSYLSLGKNMGEKLTNIVVYGLRSPWQFFEYNGYLAVFDVGLSIHEEMTISKLSNTAVSYGWPIFEGGSKAKTIDNIENYEIEITYVLNNSKLDYKESLKQLESESLSPSFFYSHYPTENDYRGAIIGGDIILGNDFVYDLNIVSADIITNELFLYDINDSSVKIVPPPISDRVTITNIRSLNNNFSDLVVGTFEGKVMFLNLP